MKQTQYRILSLLLALLLVCSLVPSVSVEAAGNQPATYSDTSNSGTRHVTCTTLSGTGASAYYTGSYTFANLSGQSDNALLQSLRTLMTSTHKKTTSYDDCKNYASKTDCEENQTGKITMLYTSYQVNKSDFVSGNRGWNREHVWPQSLGGFKTSRAGADMHHIRPDDVTTNSKRGNLKFGNVSGGSEVKGSTSVNGALGGHKSGGYFEPLDNVKGDVARICLYVYVRYGSEYSQCSKVTTVFQSVDVLLEWMALDPVDTWEMGRNEVVEAIQGNRNVFIDYPELAWKLFGKSAPANMTTPSGNAGNGGGSGGGNGGGTTPCTHSNTEIRGREDATCTKNGYTGDTYCKDCNKKLYTGNTIAAGHIEKREDPKDATCCSEGATGRKYCDRCGQTLTASQVIPASGPHTYGPWEVIEEPTATETGLQQRTCTVGGHVETQVIPALSETPTEPEVDTTNPSEGTNPTEGTNPSTPDEGNGSDVPVEPDAGEATEPSVPETQPNTNEPTPDAPAEKAPISVWVWVAVAVVAAGVVTTVVIVTVKKKKA